jgi:hypothetical protein
MELLITALLGFAWLAHDTSRNLTIPRQKYLRMIDRYARTTNGLWANEILIRGMVGPGFSLSVRRNVFCLRQLVREGMLEDDDGFTRIGAGPDAEFPVAIFNVTPYGHKWLSQ